MWIQFNDTVKRYQVKQGSDSSYKTQAKAVVLMQSSAIGGQTPVPPETPVPAGAPGRRAQTPPLEPPVCSVDLASGWEIYNSDSEQWEPQPEVTVNFHSFR